MLLMNELDGDDRLVRVLRTGFANEGVGALTDGPGDDAEGKVCGQGGSFDLEDHLAGLAPVADKTILTWDETTMISPLVSFVLVP